MNVQLGHIEVDAVGLATLIGFLLFVCVYLARCQAVKARNGSGHSSIAAGMFRLAASRGDVHAMACLGFAQGFTPDAGRDGFTALHAACIQGQQDAATWLCVHGANVNARKDDGWRDTALHYAAAKGHLDIAKLLLAFGAEAAATNFAGATPAALAARSGNHHVAQYLQDVVAGSEPWPIRELYQQHVAQLDTALGIYLSKLTAALSSGSSQSAASLVSSWWPWGQQCVKLDPAVQQLLPALLQPQQLLNDVHQRKKQTLQTSWWSNWHAWWSPHRPGHSNITAQTLQQQTIVGGRQMTAHNIEADSTSNTTSLSLEDTPAVSQALFAASAHSVLDMTCDKSDLQSLGAARISNDRSVSAAPNLHLIDSGNHSHSLSLWHIPAFRQHNLFYHSNPLYAIQQQEAQQGQLQPGQQMFAGQSSDSTQHPGGLDIHHSVSREVLWLHSQSDDGSTDGNAIAHPNNSMHSYTTQKPAQHLKQTQDNNLQVCSNAHPAAAQAADAAQDAPTGPAAGYTGSQPGPIAEAVEDVLARSPSAACPYSESCTPTSCNSSSQCDVPSARSATSTGAASTTLKAPIYANHQHTA